MDGSVSVGMLIHAVFLFLLLFLFFYIILYSVGGRLGGKLVYLFNIAIDAKLSQAERSASLRLEADASLTAHTRPRPSINQSISLPSYHLAILGNIELHSIFIPTYNA